MSIKSFDDAREYLAGKSNRPFAHNTRIKADSGGYTVTYHDNPIVHFQPDKTILDSCGWMTLTTKERLNWFIPVGFSVYQERGIWYVVNHRDNKRYVFADGMSIDDHGIITGAGDDDTDEKVKSQVKRIKAYVDGFINALLSGEIESPSGGDCWHCYMHTESGQALGEAFKDHDHIESHIDESYYVPSLLVNAVKYHDVCLLTKDGIARLWSGEALTDWHMDIMRRDLKASLTRYVKSQLGIAS